MRCEDVREQLAEHLLGTLEPAEDLDVRRHLRGCGGCRSDMASLADGMSTFARAAHEVEPPGALRDRVLGALEGEWSDAQGTEPTSHRLVPWLAAAAVAIALVGSLGWALSASSRADRWQAEAVNYDKLLGVLGGQNVRVGKLSGPGPQSLEGSAVLYDASPGNQSWALVLLRAPGVTCSANVVLSASTDGSTIKMPALHFEQSGEASTWLVTNADLRSFDRVRVASPEGITIATGAISAS